MFQTITVTQEVSPSSGSFSQLGDHLRVFRFCGQVVLICVLVSYKRRNGYALMYRLTYIIYLLIMNGRQFLGAIVLFFIFYSKYKT
jgi:hypothetical protein